MRSKPPVRRAPWPKPQVGATRRRLREAQRAAPRLLSRSTCSVAHAKVGVDLGEDHAQGHA